MLGEFLVNLLEQSGTIDRKSATEIVYAFCVVDCVVNACRHLADVNKDGSLNDKEYSICKFLHMAVMSQVSSALRPWSHM